MKEKKNFKIKKGNDKDRGVNKDIKKDRRDDNKIIKIELIIRKI